MENKRLKKTILQVVIAAVLLGEMKEFSEESCRNGLDEMLEDYGLSGQEELYETDRTADYEYNLEEWISEMTDSYQRMGEYEKCISFENEKKRKSKLRDLRILRL